MNWVLLALVTSIAWGLADFGGALVAPRASVVVITGGQQLVGVLGGAVLVLAAGEAVPDRASVARAVVCGVVTAAGLVCFYQAFTRGRATIVAPVAATGVAIPVVYDFAQGELPGRLVTAGIALAIGGVVTVLATAGNHDDAEARTTSARASIGFAALAACGFGTFLLLADSAADSSVPWFVLLARVTASLPMVAAVLLLRPALPSVRSRVWLAVLLIGGLDTFAWATSAGAYALGPTAAVSVLVGLFPVVTVLLAAAYLRERLRRLEVAGIAGILTGVVMIVGG